MVIICEVERCIVFLDDRLKRARRVVLNRKIDADTLPRSSELKR